MVLRYRLAKEGALDWHALVLYCTAMLHCLGWTLVCTAPASEEQFSQRKWRGRAG